MSELSALEKAKLRQLKRLKDEQEAIARRQREEGRIRKLERELSVRRATIIGETIRDAELSDNERSVIGAVLARRKDLPKDWSKIGDFLGAAPAPADDSAVEFVPVRPKMAEVS